MRKMINESAVPSFGPAAVLPTGPAAGGFSSADTRAGFLSRLAAFLIDLFLLGCLHFFCFALIAASLVQYPPATVQGAVVSAVIFLATALLTPPVLAMLYFCLLHACCGQTLGKMAMGLRVVALDGQAVSYGTAFLRWVSLFVSALPCGAGFLWILVDNEGRAWHDLLAGTRVVETRKILTSA